MTRPKEKPGPWSGKVLGGRYQIGGLLGTGGVGSVYVALQADLGRTVAVKVLHPQFAEDLDMLARFKQEAMAAARLGHPNIVVVSDYQHLVDEPPILVMERLVGSSMQQELAADGPFPTDRVTSIVAQVLSALDIAHGQGIIHRDLKPDNVFLQQAAGYDFVKLLDFGIAKLVDQASGASATITGTILGTPAYMSPEQARGCVDIDHRTDLYSVGVLMYNALSGELPFTTTDRWATLNAVATSQPIPLRSRLPSVDPRLEAVVERAMARDPDERYATALDMAAALQIWTRKPNKTGILGVFPVGPSVKTAPTPPRWAPSPIPDPGSRPSSSDDRSLDSLIHSMATRPVVRASSEEPSPGHETAVLDEALSRELGLHEGEGETPAAPVVGDQAEPEPDIGPEDVTPLVPSPDGVDPQPEGPTAEGPDVSATLVDRPMATIQLSIDDLVADNPVHSDLFDRAPPLDEDEMPTKSFTARGFLLENGDAPEPAPEVIVQVPSPSTGPEVKPAPPSDAGRLSQTIPFPWGMVEGMPGSRPTDNPMAMTIPYSGRTLPPKGAHSSRPPVPSVLATAPDPRSAAEPPTPPAAPDTGLAARLRARRRAMRIMVILVGLAAALVLVGVWAGRPLWKTLFSPRPELDNPTGVAVPPEPPPAPQKIQDARMSTPAPAPAPDARAVPDQGPAQRPGPDARVPAPPRPRRPALGAIRIGTQDSGGAPTWAEVFLDGVRQGTAPLLVERLQPGPHLVVLRRNGYRTIAEKVQLHPGKTMVLRYELQPER